MKLKTAAMFGIWCLFYSLLLILIPYGYTLECYACDSAENIECATRPGQHIEVEECSSANDECVIVVTAGLTRRGCRTRLYPNGYCPEPCAKCNTSLCNRYVYPEDRLRCYQCSGSDCIDVSNRPEKLLPCPVYSESDRCYTNIVHLSNTLRGCENTDLPDTCPHVCLKCNYDGCNAEKTVTESYCLQCSLNAATPNADCLRNQQTTTEGGGGGGGGQCAVTNVTESGKVTQCSNKVMLGHRELCYTHRNTQTGTLQRGCSTTMGFFPTGVLTECYGEHCNSDCVDIACVQCNSTSDANCRIGSNLKSEQCASGTVACYSCEQDAVLRRGCVADNFLPRTEEVCKLCSESDGCNRWPVRSCYHCNSIEDGDSCAEMRNPNLIARHNCTQSTELCVSTVINRLDFVYTVRGCDTDVPECSPTDPYCVRCNGSLCNNAPTSWPQLGTALLPLLPGS